MPPEAANPSPIPGPSLEAANSSFILRPSSKDWEDVAFSEFCVEAGWYQRMIRSGPWKLNYYHGYRPQLFNLADDPDELHDLADDPGCARIREELTARVLAGWDVDAITRKIAEKREQHALLVRWARATRPPDAYRWHMPPALNYLDDA